MTDQEKIFIILRHIKKVEDNCNLLARQIEEKNINFALKLIQRGRSHDLSKLNRFEFKYLWLTDDVPADKFIRALEIHRINNSHHPEYHKDGIFGMSELDIAEMVCDCTARSQEFGTDVREWFFGENGAMEKYNYKIYDHVSGRIEYYLNLLLTPKF